MGEDVGAGIASTSGETGGVPLRRVVYIIVVLALLAIVCLIFLARLQPEPSLMDERLMGAEVVAISDSGESVVLRKTDSSCVSLIPTRYTEIRQVPAECPTATETPSLQSTD